MRVLRKSPTCVRLVDIIAGSPLIMVNNYSSNYIQLILSNYTHIIFINIESRLKLIVMR